MGCGVYKFSPKMYLNLIILLFLRITMDNNGKKRKQECSIHMCVVDHILLKTESHPIRIRMAISN